MTMPSSGALNMGETTSPVSVNYELGKASPYKQTVSMNDSNVRALAGVSSTSGSTWSMSSLYGKSNVVINLSSLQNASFSATFSSVGVYPVDDILQLDRNGGWTQWDNNGQQLSGLWVTSGASATVGDNYWVRFTRTATTGTSVTTTATTGWLQINVSRAVTVSKANAGTIVGSATYTIEVSSSSSGSPVLSTATNVYIESSRA